jgi:hypothetical protein
MERRIGQTLDMVMALPASGAVVVVHSVAMRRYVEQMIRDTRGHEVARAQRVVVIDSEHRATRELAGISVMVTFDHAWRMHVNEATALLAGTMAHSCNVLASHDAKTGQQAAQSA